MDIINSFPIYLRSYHAPRYPISGVHNGAYMKNIGGGARSYIKHNLIYS